MRNIRIDLLSLLIQLLPVVLIWIGIESRLARLEGKLTLLCSKLTASLEAIAKRS